MSKKKPGKKPKLQVKRETLRKLDALTDDQIKQAAGAAIARGTTICPTMTNDCG